MVMVMVMVMMVIVMMVVVMMMVMVVVMVMMILSHYHRLLLSRGFVSGAFVLSAQDVLSIGNGIQQLGK